MSCISCLQRRSVTVQCLPYRLFLHLTWSQQTINSFNAKTKRIVCSLFTLPASVGLTSNTLKCLFCLTLLLFSLLHLPQGNAPAFFLTRKKKVLHTDLRSYLQVRECHLKNNYPSLVLVILCFHESHFAQKGRMTLAHQEEVDLLKTVILFLRLPLSPP